MLEHAGARLNFLAAERNREEERPIAGE